MPRQKRHKTKYPGVYYVLERGADGREEKVFYIFYRNRDGRQVEEKAGRQLKDAMTTARAATLRAQRVAGQLSNRERREALKAEEEAAAAAEASRWTIERLWKAYCEARPDRKSWRQDECRFNKHIKPAFGDKEPKDIVPLDVDRLRVKLLKAGRKRQSVRTTLEMLRRLVNFGTKRRLCPGLTFTLELPRVHCLKTEDLSAEQLAKLLEVLDAESNVQPAHLMKMALLTGMRRGELFRLKWEDVDFQRGFMTLVNPKGGQDCKIPLNKGARSLLESHPRTDSPYVFPGRDGELRVEVIKQVNKIKEKAGLPKDFRAMHGLRHVFASMLASSGEVDLFTLQKLLTHKDPHMTLRYAHLRDEALKRAAGVADRLISEAAKDAKEEAEAAAGNQTGEKVKG